MSKPLIQQVALVVVVALAAVGAWEILRGANLDATEAPKMAADHFVCYVIEGEAPPTRIVGITNQFEESRIKVFSRSHICVPTYKTPIKVERKKPDIEP